MYGYNKCWVNVIDTAIERQKPKGIHILNASSVFHFSLISSVYMLYIILYLQIIRLQSFFLGFYNYLVDPTVGGRFGGFTPLYWHEI